MKELKNVTFESARFSVYVLLLLALVQPFGIDAIKEGRILFILGITFLSWACVTLATLLSNAIMGRHTCEESIGKCLCHTFLFMLIANPLMGAVLLTFSGWFNTGDSLCYWVSETGRFSLTGFFGMTLHASCISIIIAVIALHKYRNDKLQKRLKNIQKINELLEQRQKQIETEEDTTDKAGETCPPDAPDEKTMIEFIGQGQNAILRIFPADLIYVESMANYADICHISGNEIRHTTLRITLKQVRRTLSSIGYVAQCHRAFLVNLNFVKKITERSSGCQLSFFGIEKLIPVSRSYTAVIREKLSTDA